MISATLVKDLRAQTFAGMSDCKKALEESEGDLEKAAEWLRKKGLHKAGQAQSRVAAEGAVQAYVHAGGRIGVLVEVNCQTDFVARTEDFRAFCAGVAMHVAGHDPPPLYVSEEDVPAEVVAKEQEIQRARAREMGAGKPAHVLDQIASGALAKRRREMCLLDQQHVRYPDKTVRELMLELSARTGEKVSIRRFTRFALGEGIERKQGDFAAEVAAVIADAG